MNTVKSYLKPEIMPVPQQRMEKIEFNSRLVNSAHTASVEQKNIMLEEIRTLTRYVTQTMHNASKTLKTDFSALASEIYKQAVTQMISEHSIYQEMSGNKKLNIHDASVVNDMKNILEETLSLTQNRGFNESYDQFINTGDYETLLGILPEPITGYPIVYEDIIDNQGSNRLTAMTSVLLHLHWATLYIMRDYNFGNENIARGILPDTIIHQKTADDMLLGLHNSPVNLEHSESLLKIKMAQSLSAGAMRASIFFIPDENSVIIPCNGFTTSQCDLRPRADTYTQTNTTTIQILLGLTLPKKQALNSISQEDATNMRAMLNAIELKDTDSITKLLNDFPALRKIIGKRGKNIKSFYNDIQFPVIRHIIDNMMEIAEIKNDNIKHLRSLAPNEEILVIRKTESNMHISVLTAITKEQYIVTLTSHYETDICGPLGYYTIKDQSLTHVIKIKSRQTQE